MTSSRRLTATAMLCSVNLTACDRQERSDASVGKALSTSTPSATASTMLDVYATRANHEIGPRADAIPDETRRAAMLDVVAGGWDVSVLPEMAVDPGSAFDPYQRADIYRRPPPKVRMGAAKVGAGLPVQVVVRIVRQNYGRFRMCYEQGLARKADLTGQVTVAFSIRPSGAMFALETRTSDLPDGQVVRCVVRSFVGLRFPEPEGGVTVPVVLPIGFSM